jgi:CBS-domain-containing membrane protein
MNIQTNSIIRGLLLRQQPGQPLAVVLKAGVGGLLAIGAVAWLSHVTGNPLLMAPFGATCVLLFSVPYGANNRMDRKILLTGNITGNLFAQWPMSSNCSICW